MSAISRISRLGQLEEELSSDLAGLHDPDPFIETDDHRISPYANSAVDNFLTDDDGISLLDTQLDGSNETLPSILSSAALFRTFSTFSRRTLATVDSVAQHFSTSDGTKSFPLATFCDLIDQCASLERAKILSVECYRERSKLGVLHRTLIFHLRRSRRSDVWLRVDRLRGRGVSIPALALRGGTTEANDVVQLADTKTDLLKRSSATPENRVEFASPPNLGAFRFFLQVIGEELLEYHVWPENCWFLCSLLQEHLIETGIGSFAIGSHVHLDLASQIRARVKNRVYHIVPRPPGVPEAVQTLAHFWGYSYLGIRLKTREEYPGKQSFEEQPSIQRISRIAELAEGKIRRGSSDRTDISQLAFRALSLERSFYGQSYERKRYEPNLSPDPMPKLLHAVQVYETYAVYAAPFLASLNVVDNLLELYAQYPIPQLHLLVSELLRSVRISSSRVNVPAIVYPRTKVKEANLSHKRRCWSSSQVLDSHASTVFSIAFSPDGRQFVSGSEDGTIRRWDAMTGKSQGKPMTGHKERVTCLTFAFDGSQIISGSVDCTVRRWATISGEPIGAPLRGHEGRIVSVGLSPDGKHIISGESDGLMFRWDAFTGERVGVFMKRSSGTVSSFAVSHDGKRVVSGSTDGTISMLGANYDDPVWSPLTGKRALGERLDGHTDAVTVVVFSPDSRQIVSGSRDGTVRLWDSLEPGV